MTKETVISFVMLVKASKPLIIKVDLPFASSPRFSCGDRVFFCCCPVMCLYVLSSVLWCPLRYLHTNDVRFVFTSSCLWEGSCLISVICVFVLFIFVLCIMYAMLPVSLDCSCLIALSVFSNIYLNKSVSIHSKTWPWNERINSLFLYDTNGVLDLKCVWFIFPSFIIFFF
jgi:hypothetical protein